MRNLEPRHEKYGSTRKPIANGRSLSQNATKRSGKEKIKQRRTKVRAARREKLGLTRAEFAILKPLTTPHKIQEFLNRIKPNFEPDGDTLMPVRKVLKLRRAHCIEGAMLAACALWIHGEPPLLLDLKAVNDYDHVVALFCRNGCWGAISKTNHPALRFRNPVYRTLRELALSYFHEYTNKKGQLTLREYSRPFDLRKVAPALWVTNDEDCWDVAEKLDNSRHYPLLAKTQTRALRRLDVFERRAGILREHSKPRRK